MKNILMILNFKNSFEGSFMRSISALSEQLIADGAKIVYLIPEKSKNSAWAKGLTSDGSSVYHFKKGLVNTLLTAKLIKKIIAKHDIKIIHSHFFSYIQHLPVAMAKGNKNDIDYIVHVHKSPPKRSALYDKIAMILTNATVYIGVSESIGNRLSINGRPTLTLPNAVDFSRLEFYDKNIKKSDYLSSGCEKTLLMFGHNFKEKGVDDVIKMLMDYDKKHKIQLLVAVSENVNEGLNAVKEICGNSPNWIKLLPARNDIATYFRLADAFVLANKKEGSPYTMIECAYMGVPIIYYDVAGQNEMKIPWSVKVSPDDPEELYKALCEIYEEDQQETYSMGLESKDYVTKHYSLGTWVYEMLNIYKNIDKM